MNDFVGMRTLLAHTSDSLVVVLAALCHDRPAFGYVSGGEQHRFVGIPVPWDRSPETPVQILDFLTRDDNVLDAMTRLWWQTDSDVTGVAVAMPPGSLGADVTYGTAVYAELDGTAWIGHIPIAEERGGVFRCVGPRHDGDPVIRSLNRVVASLKRTRTR